MFNWISENIGNIIAIVILAAVIAAIVIHLIKQKKEGQVLLRLQLWFLPHEKLLPQQFLQCQMITNN